MEWKEIKGELDCWATTRSKWTEQSSSPAWTPCKVEKREAEQTTLLAAAAANCAPALGVTSVRWTRASRGAAALSLGL